MKSKIIITALAFIVYIGCVIWICDGIKLQPHDKFLICFIGIVVIVGGATFPLTPKSKEQ